MKKIFNINKELISITTSTIEACRIQRFFSATRFISDLTGRLGDFFQSLDVSPLGSYIDHISQILEGIISAQENEDYVLLADIMEINLLPCLNTIQQTIIQENPAISMSNLYKENIELLDQDNALRAIPMASDFSSSHYHIEPATIGTNTLKYSKNNSEFYFHSNNNPYTEANAFAGEYAEPDCLSYTVFGFGMGYHIKALLEYDRRFEVTVFETNINILSLAFTYGDLHNILNNPRLHIIYNSDLKSLSSYLFKASSLEKESSKLIIHYPSLMALEDSPVKTALKEYFIKLSSVQTNIKYLMGNFYLNQKLMDLPVDTLREKFKDKTVILMAGGPSLEKSLDYLKSIDEGSRSSYVLLSVGTSYRGLVSNGITPDYVIVTDPGDHMYLQVNNIPPTGAELIYLSTASNGLVNIFQGKRYILYQTGFKAAEDFAASQGLIPFQTGGSVSTTAVDLALTFKCKRLICLGLDLSYPENKFHSFVSNDAGSQKDGYIYVKSTNKTTVPTTNVLNIYRKWIEARISREKSIEIMNISDGAYIENAHNMTTNQLKNGGLQ